MSEEKGITGYEILKIVGLFAVFGGLSVGLGYITKAIIEQIEKMRED